MGTLSEQLEEKIEESQKIARDAAIAAGTHVSPLRGKGWVIHNWGLVRTCVGIFRVSSGMGFGVFLYEGFSQMYLFYPWFLWHVLFAAIWMNMMLIFRIEFEFHGLGFLWVPVEEP